MARENRELRKALEQQRTEGNLLASRRSIGMKDSDTVVKDTADHKAQAELATAEEENRQLLDERVKLEEDLNRTIQVHYFSI